MEREGSPLDNPTGGPGAESKEGDKTDALLDPSAGAAGQTDEQGAVDEAEDDAGVKPNPG